MTNQLIPNNFPADPQLSHQRSQSVLTRNNVTVSGQGTQPMLFAHGFGCDQNMWRLVAPAFAADYQIVLFDYVGSGKSDLRAYDPERYSRLEGYAQDVLEICEALDLQNVIFVGHSVSSVIGMLAAIQAPQRFERLILVGPSPCYLNDPPDYYGGFEREDILGLLDLMDKNYLGWASFLAPVIMKNEQRPSLSKELEESFCSQQTQ
nr:alpha/beta hydrolase [Thermoleptolyngbya sp. C42_A2020_037]